VFDEEREELLADFTEVGQRVVLLEGGMGGRGNASYATSTNRAPRQHQPGIPAQEMAVWLRLKLLADAGLVGLPNAGKSTFINQVSNAGAKVGDYAFTTLVPKLGVVRHREREFVLADIPGLIEGAAEGAGIGDRFLGHIERCRVLIHLVDITGADPAEAMQVVESELQAYGEALDGKPRLIALNKIDLADAELAAGFAEELRAAGAERVFPISGATGAGIPALLDAVLDYLPARTVTENPATATRDEEAPDKEWSPLD
jgi:GTP-binding protein